jgi:hypothetical protein
MSVPSSSSKAERARVFVLFVSALALSATSAPETYSYRFTKTVDGPETLLTSEMPNVRYRVAIRAVGVAPNGRSTTENPTGAVDGTIAFAGVESAPFVAVSVGRDGVAHSELSALTRFTLGAPVTFDEGCKSPTETSPCTATFFVDFARDDGGDRGGSVAVTWRMSFSANVPKDNSPNKKSELPWSVEVVPE